MKIPARAILMLYLVLTMSGCFYSSDGIYFVEPIPGDPAIDSITTNLDFVSNLTVTDSMDLEVEYRMQIENGEPYFVDCWVDLFTIHDLRIYYSSEATFIAVSDSVVSIESDTTIFVTETDTVFSFVRDTLARNYVLEGSFQVPWDLPVSAGSQMLNMNFHFSSNTNSLGDLMRIETEVTKREYEIIFGEGEEP